MSDTIFRKVPVHIALIALFSLIAVFPSFYSGIPTGPDQNQHYQFARTVHESLIAGDMYPSLAWDTNHGFGDYGLRFYPPLTYYALSLAYFIFHDWYFASMLVFAVAFFVGGIGVYKWTMEEFDSRHALAASAIYIFAPYHLNQLYGSFLLAEFVGMAILPFCFLWVTRLCRGAGWTHVIWLAMSYALLILTHLPLTIIGSVALGIYALLLLRKRDLPGVLAKLLLAVLSSIVLTAFYWTRMLPELPWISSSSAKYVSEAFDFRGNFLFRLEHFTNFQDDVRSLWFADLLLVGMLVISIPSIYFIVRKKFKWTREMVATGAVLGFSIFMTTPLSSVIWDNVGFMQKVQFPWRWLSVVASFGAIFASAGIIQAADAMKKSRNVLLPLSLGTVLLIFVVTGTFIIKGAVYESRSDLAAQVNNVPNTEGCDCWWPVWAMRSAFDQHQRVVAGERTVEIGQWSATERTFHVTSGEPTIATLALFYYPHWRASANGMSVAVGPTGDGRLSVSIPAEAADVEVTFYEPNYVKWATVISLSTWPIMIGLLVLFAFFRTRATPDVELQAVSQ